MQDMNNYYNQPAVTPAAQGIKHTAGSVLFLITTIVFTITAVLNFASLFTTSSTLYNALQQAAALSGDTSVYEIMPVVNGFVAVVSFAALIPVLLVCIGMWCIFGSAHSTKSPALSSTGLTITQAVAIIYLVCMSILLLFVIVLFIPITAALSEFLEYSYYYAFGARNFTYVFVAIMLIAVAVMVLYVIYFAKVITTVSTLKNAARGAVLRKNVSMYVIVMNIFFAVFSLISCLLSFDSNSVLDTILSVLNITFLVLVSILLIQCRGYIKTAIMYGTPSYGAGMYNPMPNMQQPYNPQSYAPQMQNGYQQNFTPEVNGGQSYAPQYGQPATVVPPVQPQPVQPEQPIQPEPMVQPEQPVPQVQPTEPEASQNTEEQ